MRLELYLDQKGWEFGCIVTLADMVRRIGVDFDMKGMLDQGHWWVALVGKERLFGLGLGLQELSHWLSSNPHYPPDFGQGQ